MAITKEQAISDVQAQLFQGAPSDDSELSDLQVADWLSEYVNATVTTEINSKLARGEMIPQLYIKRASCEVGEEEETDCTDECENRIEFELDEEVLTLNNDAGIVLVETSEGDAIHQMSVETRSIVRNLRFAKPSENNLVYYRQANSIFVEGLKPVDLPFDKINVFYVPKQNVAALTDSGAILISDLAYPAVKDAVVSRARLQMYGTQEDKTNDGDQGVQPVYHQQVKRIESNQDEY